MRDYILKLCAILENEFCMNNIKQYFIESAELFLNEQNGEFYPFSASENDSDGIQMVTPHYENENPESEFLIQQFREFGKQNLLNHRIKVCGICYDVNLKFSDKTLSAIQIEFWKVDKGQILKEIKTFLYKKSNGKYKIEKTAHNTV